MEYKHLHNVGLCPELVRLQDLRKPPQQLYYQGSWDPPLFEQCVTVVGSRRMTMYGRQVIEKLVPQLVLAGKTIVSGFMYGVDQYAHQVCIDSGGKTIAVLGWGITEPLEGYDATLAENIIRTGGLLISEWEEQKGTLWTFPVRDRIVAALSSDVYVIEAALKSGSLITAEAARQLGRTVWAVPGPVTSNTSQGTNQLIAAGKAKAWLDCGVKNTFPDNPIMSLLAGEPLTADEIALKLNQPIGEVGAQISILILKNLVIEREGKFYNAV